MTSRDSSIDPVGACVGMRGSRVQAVVNELQGEKIDIIPWSTDTATFIVNALQPAEVVKVVLDEDCERIEVVVPDDQLSLAIGRRGQNVRLASQLTGWDIDILTEAGRIRAPPEGIRRAHQRLHASARTSTRWSASCWLRKASARVEELAYGRSVRKSPAIEGFDDGNRERNAEPRAANIWPRSRPNWTQRRKELGVDDELREIDGVTTAMLVKFGENDIKTVEDLAGCATDDLVGWTERKDGETVQQPGILDGFEMSREEAEAIVMRARVKMPAGSTRPISSPTPKSRTADAGERKAASPRDARSQEGMQALTLKTHRNRSTRPPLPTRERRRSAPVVTRQIRAPDELIRFVLGPDNAVVPDLKRKLPGRGVWVGLSRALVAQAVKKQLFSRGLRQKASASPDLPDLIETLLRRDAAQGLALANKAGLVTTGFAKVESAIASGKIAALVHAVDGAPDGKRKLRQALRRRFGDQMPPDFEPARDGGARFRPRARQCGSRRAWTWRGGKGFSRFRTATCVISRRRRSGSPSRGAGFDNERGFGAGLQSRWLERSGPLGRMSDMNDSNNSGDKTLTVQPSKTLSLKRPVEQGVVRQSFSHGRTKAVVVEKVKRRAHEAPKAPAAPAAPSAAPASGTATARPPGPRRPPRARRPPPARPPGRRSSRPRRDPRPASSCAR